MPRLFRLALLAVVLSSTVHPAVASDGVQLSDASAVIDGGRLTITTSSIARTWELFGTVPTVSLEDPRTGLAYTARAGATPVPDGEFRARAGGVWIAATFVRAALEKTADAVSATIELALVPGVRVIREHRTWPGSDSIATSTRILSDGPALTIDAYVVDGVAVGAWSSTATGEAWAFNGGSDWRSDFSHRTPIADAPADVPGEIAYLSAPGSPGWRQGVVLWNGRRGAAGSRVVVSPGRLSLVVDHARDLLNLGPIEPYRVDQPLAGDLGPRRRLLRPLGELELEPSMVGLFNAPSTDNASSLAAPTIARYLDHQARPYRDEIIYNSWGTFGRNIDEAMMLTEIDAAAEAGVETFVLDDGWQDFSGDWNADATKFPRGFAPLVERLAQREMRFGLWMSPINFHPDSKTFAAHPEWGSVPYTGASLIPSDSGFGVWSILNPSFRAYMTDVVERHITGGARYFKFDFMVWVDDANLGGPGDYFDSHDAFVAWVRALGAAHPEVTFQLDETNDNRLFANETALLGPMWFRNGTPRVTEKLSHFTQLAPMIPARALGRALLGRGGFDPSMNVAQEMASGLLGHPTFWSRMATLPPQVMTAARAWVDLYKQNRALFAADLLFPLAPDIMQSLDLAGGGGLVLTFGASTRDVGLSLQALEPGRTYHVEELSLDGAVIPRPDIVAPNMPIAVHAGEVGIFRLTPA
jgi:hypothetical protein